MRYLNKIAVSTEAPNGRDSLWLKPVEEGFALYALINGKWKSVVLIDDNETAKVSDDKVKSTVKVADFSNMTAKQCKALNVGDQIIKTTDGVKELYTVNSKSGTDMTLTYTDASTVKTATFTYSNSAWAFDAETETLLVDNTAADTSLEDTSNTQEG